MYYRHRQFMISSHYVLEKYDEEGLLPSDRSSLTIGEEFEQFPAGEQR